jgi:hypothetical protein
MRSIPSGVKNQTNLAFQLRAIYSRPRCKAGLFIEDVWLDDFPLKKEQVFDVVS